MHRLLNKVPGNYFWCCTKEYLNALLFVPPLRGLITSYNSFPTAYAVGYDSDTPTGQPFEGARHSYVLAHLHRNQIVSLFAHGYERDSMWGKTVNANQWRLAYLYRNESIAKFRRNDIIRKTLNSMLPDHISSLCSVCPVVIMASFTIGIRNARISG